MHFYYFSETPPPPYCIFAMDRLKPEGKHNLKNLRNIFIFSKKLIIKYLKSHQPHDMFYQKKDHLYYVVVAVDVNHTLKD